MAELLLDNGANVDAMSSNGVTPLHWAVVNDHTDVAELLRLRGGHDICLNFSASEWNYP